MRMTATQLSEMKARGERIVMLTAYDSSMAALVDGAGVPLILVGDSMGNTMLGYDSTLPVTIEDIIRHTQAVVRGTRNAMIVGDMPFMTFQVSVEEAVRNAGRIMQTTGCQAVKLEGGIPMAATVRAITQAGIPVMGHLGFTPQSINAFGGYRVQGKTEAAAVQLVRDAIALADAGAIAIVLELVPAALATLISERLTIPTIGIGAGVGCDGEVQVLHDILGLQPDFTPRHTQRFGEIGAAISAAVAAYAQAVRDRNFPTVKQSAKIDEAVLDRVRQTLAEG